MSKQRFSEIGLKHKDILFKELETKYPFYKFINLNYNNYENHIEMLAFDKRLNNFLGIFHIDVTDYCLFRCLSENAHLIREVLNTCEELKYNSLD